MNRQELQDQAWIFPDITIGGNPLRLSPARLSLLKRFKNPLIDGAESFGQHPGAADEMAMVLSLPRVEVKRLAAMSDTERAQAVEAFGLDNEDEIIPALSAINRKMQSVEAAGIESVDPPGKSLPEARQAQDGSQPAIGSPSVTT